MKITNTLTKSEIEDIKRLCNICEIKRIPNFDPNIYIDPKIESFYLEYNDDELIGFISLFYVDDKEMEVVAMVHPSFRGKGLFTRMYEKAKKAIPPNLTILFQVPSNYVDRDKFEKRGLKYHHGEEELINKSSNNSSNLLTPLETKDIEETAKIVASAFNSSVEEEIEFLKHLLEQDTTTALVLIEKSNVVGFIAISNTYGINTSHLFAFCVSPESRSKGYGTKILRNLIENPHGYVLRVDYDNTRAKKLYERSGFVNLSSTEYYC